MKKLYMNATIIAAIIGATATILTTIITIYFTPNNVKVQKNKPPNENQSSINIDTLHVKSYSDPRINQIVRETLPILLSILEPGKLSDETKGKLISKGLEKGWPSMVNDLEYLVNHLPKDDPILPGVKIMLDCAKREKYGKKKSTAVLICEKCGKAAGNDVNNKPEKCPFCGVLFSDQVTCVKCGKSVTRAIFEKVGNKCPYCYKLWSNIFDNESNKPSKESIKANPDRSKESRGGKGGATRRPNITRKGDCPDVSYELCMEIGRQGIKTITRKQGVLKDCSLEEATEILRECTKLLKR